jgi:putative photosynthetic complex assembly protein
MSDTSTRIYTEADRLLPRVLIRAMVGLVLVSLAIVAYARVTDRPLESTPPVSPVVAEAHLTLISDAATGAVEVMDAQGTMLASLSPEAGGFIAGVHRTILRERAKYRIPLEGPVTLRAMENGRMAILDPATGWSADLMGFGADNASAFAQLLALNTKGNTNGIID